MGLGNCQSLMTLLQKEYQIKTFIEAGTFLGHTAVWASSLFKNVLTIELSQELYEATSTQYQQIDNIKFLQGHTADHLKQLIPQLQESALFWLDAHWSGLITAGQEEECPLIDELKIIKTSEWEHFLFIDDARMFLSPPPHPHRLEHWPALHEVIRELLSFKSQYIIVIEDAIISVPEFAKPLVAQYCQDGNTKAWEKYIHSPQAVLYPVSFENLKLESQPQITNPQTQPVLSLSNSEQKVQGEMNIIHQYISDHQVIFDVGAALGDWTKEVIKTASNLEIHLFEPHPNTYQNLLQNLKLFSTSNHQLIPQNMGVGCHEGIKTFDRSSSHPILTPLSRRLATTKPGEQTPEAFTFLTTTLEQYCQRQGIRRINYLNIDVEGGELDILLGAKVLLKAGRIDYIQFQYKGTDLDAKNTLKEVFEYLQQFRYSIFKIKSNQLEPIFDLNLENQPLESVHFLARNERFYSPDYQEAGGMLDLQKLLQKHDIVPRGLIHIGAHEGEKVESYQSMGVPNILFIEANPTVFERLQNNFAKFDNVQGVNYAISDENGRINLRVTSFDQSSSILPLKHHQDIYPGIVETHQVTVESRTLDTLLEELGLNPSNFNLLSIDIQGAELLALKGANHCLKYIDAINTEVNYKELYQGCPLIDDLDNFLEQYGFERVATITPHHPDWGDALYVKKPVITTSLIGEANFGRFGNQIFKYAFLKTYALEHNLRVETPDWIGQYLFGHNDPPLLNSLPIIYEQQQPYKLSESDILNSKTPFKNVDFQGFFQLHTQYYARNKNYFCSLFQPIPEIETVVQAALKPLKIKGKTLVGLHLRRGDYEFISSLIPYLTIAPIQWYQEWLKGLWETLDEPVLFIASDEVEKVIDDFSDYNPITINDLGIDLPQAPFYPDFYILTQCDVLAISNSTFSFAAAMLNERCKFFFRPHSQQQKLIPFDPWNSEPLLRDIP